MSPQQILQEIQRLTPAQRLEIVQATLQMMGTELAELEQLRAQESERSRQAARLPQQQARSSVAPGRNSLGRQPTPATEALDDDDGEESTPMHKL